MVAHHPRLVTDECSPRLAHHVPLTRALVDSSIAATTRRRYEHIWREWVGWCTVHGRSPWLPRPPRLHSPILLAYAKYLWSKAKPNSPSTIGTKLGGISWYHRARTQLHPRLLPGDRLAFRGIERRNRPQPKREPVTAGHLRDCQRALNFSSAHDRALWGVAVVGFFFLLRASEWTNAGKPTRHAVTFAGLRLLARDGSAAQVLHDVECVAVTIKTSKTDQLGAGSIRRHGRSGQSICPVLAAWNLVQGAKHADIPSSAPIATYRREDGKICSLKDKDITSLLRRVAPMGAKLSSHSLRIGGATALLQAGAPDVEITTFGRWKSNAFLDYLRANHTYNKSLAKAMLL